MEISLDADDEAGLEGLWVWAESREAHAIRKGRKIRFTARILTQDPTQNTLGTDYLSQYSYGRVAHHSEASCMDEHNERFASLY